MKDEVEVLKIVNKKGAAQVALGGLLGFSLFWITSHHKSPVNRRLPYKKIKNVHYTPELRIARKDKHYHLHHWAIFSATYVPLILARKKRVFGSKVLHGFFIGSILQGLTYKDRFKFIKEPYKEVLKAVEDEK